MSVEVQYLGRLGNHLFQYAFGRIVAETLGYELRCVLDPARQDARMRFLGEPRDCGAIATLPELTTHFTNAPQLVPGKRVDAPEERWFFARPRDGALWDGHTIDLAALLADHRDRRLVFRGFFQRFDYYRPHQDRIRDWFALEPLADPFGITPRDIVVNLRRGWDYALAGWVISLSSYKQLLQQVPHDRLFVCGTGIDDAVRASLAELSPIYYASTPIDELRFLMRFDQIVQSNSTFCWWASFLSRASAVYTPEPDRGYMSKPLLGDALDTGEPRYRRFEAKIAQFVPFVRNPSVPLAPSSEFHKWLDARREPFGPEQLLEFMSRDDLEPVIGPLVASGAIRLEPQLVGD
jgi:hypothetical protein